MVSMSSQKRGLRALILFGKSKAGMATYIRGSFDEFIGSSE